MVKLEKLSYDDIKFIIFEPQTFPFTFNCQPSIWELIETGRKKNCVKQEKLQVEGVSRVDNVPIMEELPQEDKNTESQLYIVDRLQEGEGCLPDILGVILISSPRRSKRAKNTPKEYAVHTDSGELDRMLGLRKSTSVGKRKENTGWIQNTGIVTELLFNKNFCLY